MSSTTPFLSLVKQALDEHWSVGILNDNLDKIDTAAAKTNKKMPYCATLSDLQSAIMTAVGTIGNQEIACGYFDVGFTDDAKGIDGSKGSYILLRQSADVFSIHIFFGTSEAVAYYYSSTWHWKPGPKAVAEDITSQTNITSGKVYLVRSAHARQLVVVDAVLPSNAAYLTLPVLDSGDRPSVSTEGLLRMYSGQLLYIWVRANGTYGQANGVNGATLNGNLVWFAA